MINSRRMFGFFDPVVNGMWGIWKRNVSDFTLKIYAALYALITVFSPFLRSIAPNGDLLFHSTTFYPKKQDFPLKRACF
jgi:hypothetical protein